jgi:hypothetical protein
MRLRLPSHRFIPSPFRIVVIQGHRVLSPILCLPIPWTVTSPATQAGAATTGAFTGEVTTAAVWTNRSKTSRRSPILTVMISHMAASPPVNPRSPLDFPNARTNRVPAHLPVQRLRPRPRLRLHHVVRFFRLPGFQVHHRRRRAVACRLRRLLTGIPLSPLELLLGPGHLPHQLPRPIGHRS